MEAAVLKAVVSAVVSTLVKTGVEKLLEVLEKKYGACKGLKYDIGFIQRELQMIAADKEDQLKHKGEPSAVQSTSMEEMRDLAHAIEDCLDRFLPCAACEGEASFLDRLKTEVTSSRFASEIKKIKEQLEDAHKRRTNWDVNRSQSSTVAGSAAASSRSTTTTNTDTLVGIEKPKKELLELLECDGQPKQLNVISIVGFGGTGKTTLAKAVYDDALSRFQFRGAWVVASNHKDDTEGLLSALLKKLNPEEQTRGVQQLQNRIKYLLRFKRYLIVFDDIEEQQQWDCIKSTFPEETSSRIIVTTTIQEVAKTVCSQGNDYVYNMRTLDVKHSKDLLEAVLGRKLSEQSSTSIVDKCDGHPLALVSVAKYLRTGDSEEVCCRLGHLMENAHAFTKLRQVITNNYSSLHGYLYPLNTCLLYLCVFPNGRSIRRNSLFRRWLVEGYVPRTDLEVARDYFRELINRNSIRPIDASKNGQVKTCRTHGIMHEFMLYKSMSGNFITSLRDPKRSKSRHLFIQNPTNGRTSDMNQHTSPASGSSSGREKFCARSLTISGNAREAVSDLAKCELLRVLDLEECNDLQDDHINGIHKLWHLKYLSLGSTTISSLPRKMYKLHRLETLDLRKTMIETLPVEVIRLPHLAHLFGKIKLRKMYIISKLQRFLSEKSTLETLSGFVVDNSSAFPQLMAHMKKLRKVKIWCDSTCEGSKSWAHLLKAINKFVQDDMATGVSVRSLSLYLGDSLENFIRSLENLNGYLGNGCLSSLKLHGDMSRLPQFVTSLCGLTDLCLSSRIPMGNDLSNLRKLTGLRYLKLVQDNLEDFVIRNNDFRILQRLCLVVQTPALPTIEEGAMRQLVWLQLLCKNIEDLCDIKIEWFQDLQEVALDCMVEERTIEIWRNAAKKHPKRPRVLLLKRVDPTETEPIVKYVATEEPAPEIHASQSSSIGELNSLNSGLEGMTLSSPSPPTTELSSAGLLGTA